MKVLMYQVLKADSRKETLGGPSPEKEGWGQAGGCTTINMGSMASVDTGGPSLKRE